MSVITAHSTCTRDGNVCVGDMRHGMALYLNKPQVYCSRLQSTVYTSTRLHVYTMYFLDYCFYPQKRKFAANKDWGLGSGTANFYFVLAYYQYHSTRTTLYIYYRYL